MENDALIIFFHINYVCNYKQIDLQQLIIYLFYKVIIHILIVNVSFFKFWMLNLVLSFYFMIGFRIGSDGLYVDLIVAFGAKKQYENTTDHYGMSIKRWQ